MTSPRLQKWLKSYERREKLYPEKINSDESLRLIHKEGTPLRMDKLGSVAVLGWWDEKEPQESDWSDIHALLEKLNFKNWVLRHYGKNSDDSDKRHSPECPEVWTGLENGITFEFRRQQGQAAGLFLDQRDHRQNLKETSLGKKVLNLFAYTGGFSVYAAKGDAAQVTTVDLSPKYIDWSKRNFELNGVDPQSENFKFYSMDSLEFLKYATRKNLTYDKVICDPPSFSRNKGKDFRVDRDFTLLIESIKQVLNPGGQLLFSTNYENWSGDIWQDKLNKICLKERLSLRRLPNTCLDFENDPAQSLMKAFHIEKK